MQFNTLSFEMVESTAIVTLNRPQVLNAANSEMFDELLQAFDHIDADDSIRAAIITGQGKGFCAGADLGWLQTTSDKRSSATPEPHHVGGQVPRDGGGRITLRIFKLLKPLIAAINGVAAGFGATMTLPMDIRLASTNARFGFVFTARGLVPESASTYFLPRIVGVPIAMEWCLSGRVFSAEEALRWGLVKELYEPEYLLPAALRYAQEMTANSSPVSAALTRQMLWHGLGYTHPMEAHRIESRGVHERLKSKDIKEGISAFREKRAAQFPDKVSVDIPDISAWWEDFEYN